MTDLLKLSGDDVRGFDHECTAFNPAITTTLISGVSWFQVASSASSKIVGKSPLGEPATTYFGFQFRKPGNPSSSNVFLQPFTSGGTTSFRLRLGSTGQIILDSATTNSLDTSVNLSNDTTYVFMGTATTSTVTVTIYAADGSTVIDTITASSTYGLVDNWRMGQINSTPALPSYLFRMLLVSDTAISTSHILEAPDAVDTGQLRIGIIGDSLTSMSGSNGSILYSEFTSRGFPTRNVGLWGVGGKRIAVADLTGKTTVQNMTDIVTQLGDVDVWLFGLGTNDRPYDNATVDAAIDTVLAAVDSLTPGARVAWMGLTSKGSASSDDIRVTDRIELGLADWAGDYTVVDWDSIIRALDGGANPSDYWVTTDNTHMTLDVGYPVRAATMVDTVLPADAPETEGTAAAEATASASISKIAIVADTAPTDALAAAQVSKTSAVAETALGVAAASADAGRVVTTAGTASAVADTSVTPAKVATLAGPAPAQASADTVAGKAAPVSGTGGSVASATGQATKVALHLGAGQAIADAAATQSTVRVTAGTAAAQATATAAIGQGQDSTGTAPAEATVSATVTTVRVTTGSAVAAASASSASSRAAVTTGAGTAHASASATATPVRNTSGSARSIAATVSTTTRSAFTAGTAFLTALAVAAIATTRAKVGTAPAVASATAAIGPPPAPIPLDLTLDGTYPALTLDGTGPDLTLEVALADQAG